MQMNRQWMYASRLSGEFTTGLKDFLVVANANKQGGFVICPCVGCKNQKGYSSPSKLPPSSSLPLSLSSGGARGSN